MESPDSDTSPDADSSPVDSSSADSSSPQAQSSTGEIQVVPAMETTTVIHNDDSASDVSMSTDSEDEDDDGPNTASISATSIIQDMPQPTALDNVRPESEASKKRKYSDPIEAPSGHIHSETLQEIRKRLKPDDSLQSHWTPDGLLFKDKSLLPPEIWHHIFTFCPPRVLGLLLQVNRIFNAYLDPASPSSGLTSEPLSRSAVQILNPETIWRTSRLLHLPGTPVPLSGKSELDMWKLACGSFCQFCGKKRQANSTLLTDQWHPGPGENGVVPIWSFGIRTCGSCVQTRSTKEIDLLLSSSVPSPLVTALPFIFLSNDLHVIPTATLQNGQPTGIQIAKHFFNSHIEEIKREFDDVKAMGSATAEEWIKGLEGRGRERRNDAVRWERWEVSGGVARMRNIGNNGIRNPERQYSNHSLPAISTTPVPETNGHISMYQSHNGIQQSSSFHTTQSTQLPLPFHTAFAATNPPPRFDSPTQNGLGSYPPRMQPRHERTKEEVAELKAARRAEIEKRCMLLNPPIIAGVLAHMASFQAAIQIIQPLDDGAWEVLKPRLLSQREEAEQRENDRIAQTRVVQERFDERRFQDMQAKSDSKDLVDREWDDIQAPLRARIGGYADEIIRDGWNGGEKVSYETAPLFAAEVLIYIRKRFYAEVAKDEAAVRATGREPELDPPNGPYTRRLILENMKWVFDTKIKPHTEPYRKELFLCNACEYASKYYGFEGVIQHYAAKHTSALSVGSVVVHWKSEWPEYPPFNPDPNNVSVAPYYAAGPSASVPYAGSGPSIQQNYGYGGYQTAPVSAPMSAPNPHVYQESPGPYYGHPQFGEQYSGHQNGPYAPPSAYPDTSQGYQTPQYSIAPPQAPLQGYNDPSQDYSQQTFGGQYQPTAQNLYTSPHPSTLYPATIPEVPAQQPTYAPPVAQYGQPYNQQPTYPPNNFAQGPPPRTEEYMAQLQDIARNARDVWNSIGNLKDVPGALKVYTIIYHILQRFRETFQEDPSLAMMVDGLSNNKDMRPVRNINGLLCKACSLGMAGSSAPQRKRFSFPQLVNHFHSVHEQGISQDTPGHIPDWTKDMVDLPDLSDLRLTSDSPGMDESRLKLFTEALPELFAVPAPSMSDLPNRSNQRYESMVHRNEYRNLAPSVDNHEKYYTAIDSGRPSETGSVTYDSGEYDPRHPGDLPMEPCQQYRAPRRSHRSRERDNARDEQPFYRYMPQDEEPRHVIYEDLTERSYSEQRPISRPLSQPPQILPLDDYERVIVRDEPAVYIDRPIRYRDSGDVEYRVRREPRVVTYEESDPIPLGRDYRLTNSLAYQSNKKDVPSVIPLEPPDHLHPAENARAEQNRIYEVVAQISQQAQQARERQPVKEDPIEAGSEDGEVRTEPKPNLEIGHIGPSDEASNAAERFLNEFRPGESVDEAAKKKEDAERRREDELRAKWEAERSERNMYQVPAESHRRLREREGEEYDGDHRVLASSGRLVNPGLEEIGYNGYILRERVPAQRQSRAYAYEDRYVSAVPEQAVPRERSPELVDRRYKLNNVVYRDDRQDSHGTHRTPSRYARYESVRLENDRARSRSPVYVKMGAQSAQYRERSPAAPTLRREPLYRTRTPPPAAEELAYERAPRQEYYRVYADEPRPREPQYAEAFEYVRVADPQGDYMIRRPVRREPEPIYATYEDEVYTRQPVYESRAPAPRPEPTYFEEYDPRHPAPPPQAPVQQVRYQ